MDESSPAGASHPCPGQSFSRDGLQSGSFHVLGADGVRGESKRTRRFQKQLLQSEGPATIEELLYQYPTCPPSAYKFIKEFFNNNNVNKTTDQCRRAQVDLRNWISKLNWWTIKDFITYYNDPAVHPYWNAYNRLHDDVYYTPDESVEIADQLLLYQYKFDLDNTRDFLQDLLNVLDKRIPKLNTLAIHAPPNSGKNFFFDAVCAYFINYGSIGTANKTNQFAFAEAAHKRLVLWNEPSYEACHVEKLKEILGGDTTRVQVKYLNDQPLQGPPIIICTNDTLSIFGMEAFRSRIKLHYWMSAPFLKQYNKKIHPLFLIKLFNKYNLL